VLQPGTGWRSAQPGPRCPPGPAPSRHRSSPPARRPQVTAPAARHRHGAAADQHAAAASHVGTVSDANRPNPWESFAPLNTMDDRLEWEHATEHSRHLTVAADAELRRRHPDQQIEPLHSTEPARPCGVPSQARFRRARRRVSRTGSPGPGRSASARSASRPFGTDPAPLDDAMYGGVTDPSRHRVDGMLLLILEPLAQRRCTSALRPLTRSRNGGPLGTCQGLDRPVGVVRTGRWSRMLAVWMAHDASSK
jgi:hypothetical protein